jgi:phytoene/squalene synthetase
LVDEFHLQRQNFRSIDPDQKVDFIFDNLTDKKPILEAWDEYIGRAQDHVKDRFGATPRFENDQEFLPLQAADLWAWWVREWYEEDASPI